MNEKEIRCKHCKSHKLLAKQRENGKIYVWCKECRKEVELEVEPHEPIKRRNIKRDRETQKGT